MRKFIYFVLTLSMIFLTKGAYAAQEEKADLGPADFKMESEVVEITAKVVSVDLKTRLVTLEGPEGNQVTIKVDDDVENLDKVKKGNLVNLSYYDSLAWSLIKKDKKVTPVKEVTEKTFTAQPGKKPMKVEVNQTRLITTVRKIDKEKETVTLEGPEGNEVSIKVKDPKNLEGVKKGDQVEITYTESVAVAVTKK